MPARPRRKTSRRKSLAAMTRGMTVLAIGPGLGQSEDTARFCIGLLKATSMPAVIDADALNILAKNSDVLPRTDARMDASS